MMAHPERGGALHVVFELHGHLMAVAAAHVARLLLASEARAEGGGERAVVQADGATWAAWNLGTLLGLPPASSSWILLHARTIEGATPLALQVGACLVVRPLVVAGPLPPGIFTARRGALDGVFAARQVAGSEAAVAGLVLDPGRLLLPAEVASSRARVIERLASTRGRVA